LIRASGKPRGGSLDGCIASAAHGLIKFVRIGKNVRRRNFRSARIERWFGRVLHAELYRPSVILAGDLRHDCKPFKFTGKIEKVTYDLK
jgi:hypothetical protein